MGKTTYLSSIISALNKLNGMGSLNEIYDVIEKEAVSYTHLTLPTNSLV